LGATACSNSVGSYACTCSNGYSGTGTQSCTDNDECGAGATAACGAGAIACSNSAGSYTCTCGSGYLGTGTQACTDDNECADGALAACGTGATACTNSAGSYACSCGGQYVPTDDGRGCRLRQWGTALQVQADTAPSSRNPRVGMDGAGNLIAVWIDGTRVFSSRYTRSSDSWTTPVQIVSEHDTDANAANVAVNVNGNAVAAWYQDGVPTRNMYKATYSPGGGWSQGTLLEYEDGIAGQTGSPDVAIGDNGNAIAVWQQHDGSNNTIRARHYIGGTWQAPVTISNSGSSTYPRVAIDSSGNAIAIWQQFTGGKNSFRGARYASGSWGTPAVLELDADAENLATLPDLAMNAAGVAFVIWRQSDGTRYNIWANRFSGASWGTAVRLENVNTGDASHPGIGVDASGNAIALFPISDGTRDNLWAARYSGGSWGSASMIESENLGSAARPVIGFDGAGNGFAVWQQSDGTRNNIWSARYASGTWATATTIESSSHDGTFPKLVVHSSGIATAIWGSGTPYRDIWANHYD
jgi:hypothetical protein